ncbi:site-2 protease family protein [Clostridium polynesiense]|uniref:site-2 protease family protein n=1 Tax=Clostridium polynesiense TaxID=1325933 RepID=UPI0005901798|nr:site-2 protease family protein [Clostridium polynesiense]
MLRDFLLEIILIIPAILIGFTFHEFAHALVADRLGDKTPRFQGRLTFNPFAHIDPMGFIMILFFHFGWAKPVQVNTRAFKNRNRDHLLVSVAGPLANLVAALLFAVINGLFIRFTMNISLGSLGGIISTINTYVIMININLALFNLLPIPGLDGFHILEDLFPRTFYKYGEILYRYQFIIMILIIGTNITGTIIGIPAGYLNRIMTLITFGIAF